MLSEYLIFFPAFSKDHGGCVPRKTEAVAPAAVAARGEGTGEVPT